jgi:hypothetical protein
MGSQPTSVRFDDDVVGRLREFTASHPGMSLSAATSLLVDEGLRMHAHPLVYFVDGATGRRARLLWGPDVCVNAEVRLVEPSPIG